MFYSEGKPSLVKKEQYLRKNPIFQNTVLVDQIYEKSFTLSSLHFHEFIEISFVVSGSGIHRIWNETAECKKGDLYILNVGVPHNYFAKSETEQPTVCNILFDPGDLFDKSISDPDSPRFCYGIFKDNASSAFIPMKSRQFDLLENMYQLLESENTEKKSEWMDVVKAELSMFLIKVKRILSENENPLHPIKSKDRVIVSSAVRYVLEHYSDSELTLEKIAQSLYMSKSYLSRMFYSVTGEYFSDYVRNVRLKQACHLLEETQMTNEQIVYNCGLKDVPTFYRLFKSQFMQTPNQYRHLKNKNYNNSSPGKSFMTGVERVRNTILGKQTDRQPIYGWLNANLGSEIAQVYGSVSGFEDKYKFDLAHIFAGPNPFKWNVIEKVRATHGELTPDLLLNEDFFTSPDNTENYKGVTNSLTFHKKRSRFCYIQTPGFFEQFNSVFGFENQLLYLALYPDELNELYRRQADWTVRFAEHCIDLGVDMIHISDDWGSQKDIMFSPHLWKEIIYPNLKRIVDYVHSRGCFVSLHSDGNIMKVCDDIAQLGIDVVHPWQERANMSYDTWLKKYSDKFAIFGGICVQTALGIMPRDELEAEIYRVFGKLRGKRWICCTTQFVQEHCSMEDLIFAYDLIYKLARE